MVFLESQVQSEWNLSFCNVWCCWCMIVAGVAKCGSMKKCIQNTPLWGYGCIFNLERDPGPVGLIDIVSLEMRMMLALVSFFWKEGEERFNFTFVQYLFRDGFFSSLRPNLHHLLHVNQFNLCIRCDFYICRVPFQFMMDTGTPKGYFSSSWYRCITFGICMHAAFCIGYVSWSNASLYMFAALALCMWLCKVVLELEYFGWSNASWYRFATLLILWYLSFYLVYVFFLWWHLVMWYCRTLTSPLCS